MWLPRNKLQQMGFAYLGEDVHISDKAIFYNPEGISIGDRSRIDDLCLLSAGKGGISIGMNVHIAVKSSLRGQGRIILSDFAGLSGDVDIYSSSDTYSGEAMTNPTIPDEFTNVIHDEVTLGRHVIVGAKSVILPGVNIEEGVAIGAFSLVKKDCEAWSIYAGNPLRLIGKRSKEGILQREQEYLNYLERLKSGKER